MTKTKIQYDYIIVGAGIIGLTIAREIKRRNSNASVCVIEKEARPGVHATGRNSGVLHAGIYYATDSLKAKFCQAGSEQMKDYADKKGISIKHCGKLIVATSDSELETLEKLYQQGLKNALSIEKVTERRALEIEPLAFTKKEAIWSPKTSVIHTSEVTAAIREDLEEAGTQLLFEEKVVAIDPQKHEVALSSGKKIRYGFLINSAGAYADKIAHYFDVATDLTMLPFKGLYRSLSTQLSHQLKTLIYPTPDPQFPFLGVHTNMTFAERSYVGPGALPALGRENYHFFKDIHLGEGISSLFRLGKVLMKNSKIRRHSFEEIHKLQKSYFDRQIQKLLRVPISEHVGGYAKAGIRPQLYSKKTNELVNDFEIKSAKDSLHVLNAISPAFTCSFEFAKHCVAQVPSDR